jgi:hypothetical protein
VQHANVFSVWYGFEIWKLTYRVLENRFLRRMFGRKREEVRKEWRKLNYDMLHNLCSSETRQALGSTQPPIQWVPGAFPPWAKRPGREADHSPPASAEVKVYTSIPIYAFIAQCLIS